MIESSSENSPFSPCAQAIPEFPQTTVFVSYLSFQSVFVIILALYEYILTLHFLYTK